MARRAEKIARVSAAEVAHSKPSATEGAELKRQMVATTEKDIRRHMIEDGYDPDVDIRDQDIISPWFIRRRLGMTQQEFAETLGVPVATLRNWEQRRVTLDPATIALMRILAHEPKAALRALRRHAA